MLNEKIKNDLVNSMKNKDKFTLSVLRMLKSAIQLESISKNKELTDEEIIMVIKKNVKQRESSILEFEKFNKTEEVNNLQKEIEILKQYLPAELSEEDINKEITKVFEEVNPSSMKDMGIIMKKLTECIGSRADMSKVSVLVKNRIMESLK
jgi:uncharacterized protein YqeY